MLLSLSLASFASLVFSDLTSLKENKITAVAVFLVLIMFLLSAILVIAVSTGGRLRAFRTVFVFIGICAAGIFAVFLNVLNFEDNSADYSSLERKADSGVILGAAVWGGNRPSPVLKERIVKGYEIYKNRIVPKLVLTGGGSPNELTEGEVAKNELIKYGVEPGNLIMENSSSSTVEQIHFVRDQLFRKNGWKRIILISDNFHLLRAKEISEFSNMKTDCIASDKQLTTAGSASYCFKESLALIIFWMSGV